MFRRQYDRGFALLDCVVAILVLGVLASVALPSIALVRHGGMTQQDAVQQQRIHAGMVGYAAGAPGGKLPIPGLINRKASGAQQIPGRGEEDLTKNRTPCLYSACVALQLFNTDVLVGPTEVNPVVQVFTSYNYLAYNPGQDTYWDGDVGSGGTIPAWISVGLRARISATPNPSDPTMVSHVSFAHLLLTGMRKDINWRSTASASRPLISTRGCKNGLTSGDDYTRSPTLLLHGAPDQWDGNVCFADNHVEFASSFTIDSCKYACPPTLEVSLIPDNLFRYAATIPSEFAGAECVPSTSSGPASFMGGDTVLGIHPGVTSSNSTNTLVVPSFDALIPP